MSSPRFIRLASPLAECSPHVTLFRNPSSSQLVYRSILALIELFQVTKLLNYKNMISRKVDEKTIYE